MKIIKMLLANCGDIQIKKYIDDNPHEINILNDREWSPLGAACVQGKVGIIVHLLEKGANVNYANEYTTCLLTTMLAQIPRSIKMEIIKILHQHNANLDACISDNFIDKNVFFDKKLTALDIAVMHKDAGLFNLLVKLGANKEKVLYKSKMEKFIRCNARCNLFLFGLYRDKSAGKANSIVAEYGNKLPKDVVKLIVDYTMKDFDQTPLTKLS